jgi:hypothetical protein
VAHHILRLEEVANGKDEVQHRWYVEAPLFINIFVNHLSQCLQNLTGN